MQQQGSNAVSVNWGAWSGGGMALQDQQSVMRMERMGLGMLTPEIGLAALAGVIKTAQVLSVTSLPGNLSHITPPDSFQ